MYMLMNINLREFSNTEDILAEELYYLGHS